MTQQPITPHDKIIKIAATVISITILVTMILPSSVLPIKWVITILWIAVIAALGIMAYRAYYARKQGLNKFFNKMIIFTIVLLLTMGLMTYIVY